MAKAMTLCCAVASVRGVVGNWDWSEAAVHVPEFRRYPGYSGSFDVHGSVMMAGGSGYQRLTWSLFGIDAACTRGAGDNVKNGCGIHVHKGHSCEVASEVGGHYFSSTLASDPWAPIVYVSASDGSSVQDGGVTVATGLSNQDITGRVMVVHELQSGARIACGRIEAADNMCAGYKPVQPNSDIDGVLLAKVWSPSIGHCCALCSQEKDCEGYVFHLDQCYLKQDLGSVSYKPLAMTRVKEQSCAAYAPPLIDVDMSGDLLAVKHASGPKDCCALCNSVDRCEGFVQQGAQCLLKKNLGSPSSRPGAVTRLRYHAAGNSALSADALLKSNLRGSNATSQFFP